jgi:hypothetical protein
MALDHPSSLQETKNRASELRIELEAQMTRQQVEAAQIRARDKSFESAVDELLKQV